MSITDHPAYTKAYREMQADLGKVEPISETMRRWEAQKTIERRDPVLALLLRIEAIADHRAENHQCMGSKLTLIAQLAREAAVKHTGNPFRNPGFP